MSKNAGSKYLLAKSPVAPINITFTRADVRTGRQLVSSSNSDMFFKYSDVANGMRKMPTN